MCKGSRERAGSLCFSFSVWRALLRLEGWWEVFGFVGVFFEKWGHRNCQRSMWNDYSKSKEACQRNILVLEAWFLLFYSKTVKHKLFPRAGGRCSALCRAVAEVKVAVGRSGETRVRMWGGQHWSDTGQGQQTLYDGERQCPSHWAVWDNSLAVGKETLCMGSLKCSTGAVRLTATFRNDIL